MVKIEIETDLCADCGEMLVKDAVTPFFLTIQNGKLVMSLCNSCFEDRMKVRFKGIVDEVIEGLMDDVFEP